MKSRLRILYLGPDHGTSRQRADALRRLGHEVELVDPWSFLPSAGLARKVLWKLTYEVGPAWLERFVARRLSEVLAGRRFDLVWNNQCELVGLRITHLLKAHAGRLVTYADDDPFGTRDKRRFSLYRKAMNHYELVAVVREPNITEARASGASRVIRVPRAADEVAHRPLDLTPEERAALASEVLFIGTWMPERGPFMARLLELGVSLSIRGNGWQKAREWPLLSRVWKGPGIEGADYVKAIQCAKVCLGLVSKSNRDLSTHRSAEIPYIGSVLCAERTADHLAMYREGEEAVFWDTPEECAEKCIALLENEAWRLRVARSGRERCVQSGYVNERLVGGILETLYSAVGERAP
ncbi:MAG: hypothetical protein Kow006_21830 [Gammaproteobacteria bacterium]